MSAEGSFQFDAEYLLGLARQKSSETRSRLTEIILDMFDNRTDVLTDRQRALMFGILHNIIDEIEQSVRQAVAGRMALMDDVPRDFISRLANDEIKVAYPVLEKSGLLRDTDLIEVIQHRTEEHMLAITMRKNISEQVSDALVNSGRESVIISLLKNSSAKISSKTMEYLVEQSRRVDSFHEPIVNRDDLRPDLAKRMFLWVSAALREHIISSFNLDKDTVDDLLEQVAEEQLSTSELEKKNKATALAEVLRDEGMVTVDMLIAALGDGEIPLFIALFAKVSKLREYLIQRLLFEPGGEGLAIAARAIGITRDDFKRLYIFAHLAKAGKAEDVERELPPLLKFYEATPRKAAMDVLKMWHRGTDYLSSLRELQTRLKDHG